MKFKDILLHKINIYIFSFLLPIIQIGVRTMFQIDADFSNMENGTHNLFVSNILQKAGIEVNEKGSIAYAATGKLLITTIIVYYCSYTILITTVYAFVSKKNFITFQSYLKKNDVLYKKLYTKKIIHFFIFKSVVSYC